jgi:sulfatase maturation enzyme AslB (radical SAM superfamily)
MDGISNTFCLLPSALGKSRSTHENNLVSLLDGYFDKNAHHINVNILNREVLEDAHLHPEKYPNLTIRVSGYAVRFTQLTPAQRAEVLARTMHGSSVATHSKVSKIPDVSDRIPLEDNDTVEISLKLKSSRLADIEDLENIVGGVSPGISSSDCVNGCVNSIETFSTTDGPGIRNLVFLQGCPKRCIYCSNPETQFAIDSTKFPEILMTDKDIADIVRKYRTFLLPEKGGITISGGEPLLQADFVRAIFKRVQDMDLTTCLDTAGHGNPDIWEKV